MGHWFFPIEEGNLHDAMSEVSRQLAACPAAAAILDEEAERFGAVAMMIYSAEQRTFERLCKGLGIRIAHHTQVGHRQAAYRILRMWKQPKVRELLEFLFANTSYDSIPDAGTRADQITPWLLADAYDQGQNTCLVVRLLRVTGQSDIVDDFLEVLSPWAKDDYRLWLDVARLMMARLVLGGEASEREEQEQKEAREHQKLVQRLQSKSAAAGALARDARELERSRQEWVQLGRLVDETLLSKVEQARQEKAAAAEVLAKRRADQERELRELSAHHQTKAQDLQKRLEGAVSELAAALAEREKHAGAKPLTGYRVAVLGDDTNADGYRLLVESLGARYVAGQSDVTICLNVSDPAGAPPGAFCAAGSGLAVLERMLRTQVVPALGGAKA